MPRPTIEDDLASGRCPSRDVLCELMLGRLPMETIDRLSKHVESCSVCQAVLDTTLL